jgi:hypothetical protein
MRPITEWQHLMSSRVSVALRTSLDTDVVPTYGTPITDIPAHLSRKRRLIADQREPQLREIVSSQSVHLGINMDVPLTAKVTLSTGDVGSTEETQLSPVIVHVRRRFDQAGAHSITIYFE